MDDRRYYGFDALRGYMMMLGIVLHGANFYMSAPPPTMPVPIDRNNSYLFDLIFHFIHSFRMPTFFVLAGFFTSLLVEKRGLWGTYKNRASRVLAPLVAGIFTVVPLASLFAVDYILSVRFGTHDIVPDMDHLKTLLGEIDAKLAAQGLPTGQMPGFAHLWFLYYLCMFYLLIPACQLLIKWALPVERIIRILLASPAAMIVLGLFTAATLWPFHGGQVHEGFIYLKPHPPSLVYYGWFFVLGYLFHSYRELLQTSMRTVSGFAFAALLLFPLSLYVSDLDRSTGSFATHLAAVIVNGMCSWAMIYAFLGAAQRFFDFESPWILYASQSSYWVFMVHLPLISFAAWMLVPYDLPALVKFSLAVSFTTIVCFVTYHYWVQRTWVSVFLNGRRFDLNWPWLPQEPRLQRRLESDKSG
jgi:glucans biosynthesis protein C